jgi:hypothetical protein
MSQPPPQGPPSWLPPSQPPQPDNPPPGGPSAAAGPPPPAGPPPAGKRPLWKRPWFIITGILAVLAVGLGGCITAVALIATSSPPGTKQAAPATTVAEPPTTEEPTTDPPESTIGQSQPTRKPVGYTATITADDVEVGTITISQVQTAAKEPGAYGSTPDHGRYLVVRVKVAGTGDPFEIGPYDFYVRGKDGSHTEDATFSTAWGASWDGGTLQRGEHQAGTIVYDVNNGARHGQIVYAPVSNGSTPVFEWSY